MPADEVTNINDLGLVFAILLIIMILFMPRRLAIVPMIVGACYITLGQVVNVAGFNFSIMRILVLFGWVRLIIRREFFGIKLNAIDKGFIWWVILCFVIYNIQWQTSGALVNRLGFAYNAIGIYFLFRFIIRDLNTVNSSFKALALIIVPLALAMLVEKGTGKNIFSIFGGVAETTLIRDGKLRCQGPFIHPILAGTFGATILPLFISLWFQRGKSRLIGISGTAAASIIAMTASSSGAIVAYGSGVLAMAIWPFRNHMRVIRWGILVILILLHLVMKAPVWYLMARVGELMGGTGWHRSYLIDQAIGHFDEWWLLGVKYTGHWMPQVLGAYPDQADITNEYIRIGVDGGLFSIVLFVVVIMMCFRAVGRTIRCIDDSLVAEKITVWSMGAALFAHVVSFLSVSYFDQIIMIWYLILAMISIVNRAMVDENDGKDSRNRNVAHFSH